MIQELVMVRDWLLCLSRDYFAPVYVDALKCSIVCRLIFILILSLNFTFICVCVFVYFVYDIHITNNNAG